MASVDKLSIRGIRSFSPDKEMVIKFYKPLTVIFGHNGCGKTTIIECLKYACSGTMPPGAANGQSFVHDPKMADQSEVKAVIKLKFKNRAGIPVTIQRSMQLRQNKRSMTFKALDCVVQTVHRGEKSSVTQRCAEVDILIPNLMGVKKAVLDNVIFCHQEDSNWPLQEGSALKKKFDAIFESTRYTKALKVVHDLCKKQKDEKKDHVRDLTILKSKVSSKNEIVQDHERCKADREEASKRQNDLQEKVDDLCARLEAEEKTLHTLGKLQQQERDIMRDLKHTEKEVQGAIAERAKTNFPDGFNATMEELEHQRQKIDADERRAEDAVGALRKRVDALEKKISEAARSESKLLEERGRLQGQIDSISRTEKEMMTCAQDVARACEDMHASQFASDTGESARRVVAKLLERLDVREAKSADALKRREVEVDAKLEKMGDEVGVVNARCRRSDESIKAGKAKEDAANTELRSLQKRLRTLRKGLKNSDARLKELAAEIAKNGADADASAEVTVKQLKTTIVDCDRNLASVDFDVQRLEEERDALVSRGDVQNRIRAIRERLERFENQQSEAESRLTDGGFVDAVGHPVDAASVSEDYREILKTRREIESDANEDVEAIKTEIAVAKSELKKASEVVESARSELSRCKEKLVEFRKFVENDPDLDAQARATPSSLLDTFSKREIKLRKEKFMSENIADVCAWFESMGTTKHRCPVCTRAFKGRDEAKMIQALKKIAEEANRSEHLDEIDAKLEKNARASAAIKLCIPAWTRSEELESEHIPEAERKVSRAKRDVEERTRSLDAKRKSLEAAKTAVAKIEEFCDDVREVEAAFEQVSELKLELERERRKSVAGASLSARDIVDVEKELDAARQKRDDIRKRKERAQSEIVRTSEKHHERQKRVVKLREDKAELEKSVESLRATERSVEVCKSSIQSAKDEIKRAKVEHAEASKDLRKMRAELESAKKNFKSELSKLRKEKKMSEMRIHELRSKLERLEMLRDGGKTEKRIEDVETKLEGTRKKQNDLKHDMKEIQPELAEKQEGANKAKLVAVAINAEIRVLRAKSLVEDVKRKLDDIRRQIRESFADGVGDAKTLRRRIEELKRDRETALAKIHEIAGRITELKRREKNCEGRLSRDFKNVEEKHRRTMIDVETSKMAVDDLDRYYKAVDRALMLYHTTQLEKVNILIAQLWSLTYKGGDIEKIEIRSDTKGKGRSFNYKIVMLKGDTEVHMRGRCSAGQKVLASLVIRLALADVFGDNCGVLTLDEPTTNLDERNKRGLAEALGKIIEERKQQTNFQLIVITHDETFVHLLGEAQASIRDGSMRPEYYYMVDRVERVESNDGGGFGSGRYFSRITQKEWG